MITYKPVVNKGGRRKDGTWPVKIRVTFKGVVRRLPTTLVCTDADLTRSGRIKNADVLNKADEIVARMRAACADLSPFTLESWSVDDVVGHIRDTLTSDAFRLDFFTYGERVASGKKPGTARTYITALNALARYLGCRELDVNDITRQMLRDFAAFIDAEPKVLPGSPGNTAHSKRPGYTSALYLVRLGHIYANARREYNDEDKGLIVIPRTPFEGLAMRPAAGRGQRPQEPETIQRMIDEQPERPLWRVTFAAFLLSFCTQGANMADLWAAPPVVGDVWTYNRIKTKDNRPDEAEVRVRLTPQALHYARMLGAGTSSSVWLPALRRWKSAEAADGGTASILHDWQDREGLPRFSFYAARKTFGTLARRLGVEKATVDEALAHVGDFKLADIYAERNWSLSWEATEKVLALFHWPDL